jgi:hypothetical protein
MALLGHGPLQGGRRSLEPEIRVSVPASKVLQSPSETTHLFEDIRCCQYDGYGVRTAEHKSVGAVSNDRAIFFMQFFRCTSPRLIAPEGGQEPEIGYRSNERTRICSQAQIACNCSPKHV